MNKVFLSLGSNSGPRQQYIDAMYTALENRCLAAPIKRSRLLETEPLEVDNEQEWFINCVVSGRYAGSALELLKNCLSIEQSLGRIRGRRHAPRTADIDILLFGNRKITIPELTIPHPRLIHRRFLLEGLIELAPDLIIPGMHTTVQEYYITALPLLQNQRIRLLE